MTVKTSDPKDILLLKILTYPDNALKIKSEPVAEVTDEIRVLAERMTRTMFAAPGLGLAAPQVGRNIRLIVVDAALGEEGKRDPVVMVNPEIVESSGAAVEEEGCLSVPEVWADVTRPERAVVRFTSLDGGRTELEAEGTLARCLAHEIDHLDGILFWDRLSRFKRDWLKLKYKRS